MLHMIDCALMPFSFRLQCRFDRLKSAQVQPGADEHDRKVENAKYPRDAVVEPNFRVEYVESSSLCSVRPPICLKEKGQLTNSSPLAY